MPGRWLVGRLAQRQLLTLRDTHGLAHPTHALLAVPLWSEGELVLAERLNVGRDERLGHFCNSGTRRASKFLVTEAFAFCMLVRP